MTMDNGIIETGVDKLVRLVKESGRISLGDATRNLGVSQTVIQEWVDFLEEEGIISVEYKLTTPYLVDRKLTKKEVDEKAKEFSTKKDIFVRKAEVNLNFLSRQAEDLKKIKEEFDRLKNDLGMELGTVKSDLKQFEEYQQMRSELQKQLETQKTEAKNKIQDLTNDILREQKKYRDLVSDIMREKQQLIKEKREANSIEESEKILNSKLSELKKFMSALDKRIHEEDITVKNSEHHIDRLNSLIEETKARVKQEKSSIEPLMEKIREQEKKIINVQKKIMEKLARKGNDAEKAKNISKKLNDFFNKRLAVANLVEKVNNDRDELEKSLIDLVRKAKSFQLTRGTDVGAQMSELEKKFKEVESKKGIFEQELGKLNTFFKG